MRLINFLKSIPSMIRDPERNFSERVFVLLTIISDIAVTIALIGDLIIGENTTEVVILTIIIFVVPAVVFGALHFNIIEIAIRVIVTALVLVVLPLLFVFGGGVEGGGYIWFIFGFMYVGLVISGVWRVVMLALLFFGAFFCYQFEYYYPQYIPEHSREVFYMDTFISLILVGVVCFFMVMFQNNLFKEENERAKTEARKAEELNKSQNRFFSSMSHEIRTPINSILGLNELILRNQNADEEILNNAVGIQGSGEMLLTLINDILDFSKIDARSMELFPVDYRVGDLMSEVVNMIWHSAREKGLKLDITIDPKVPSVLYGDEIRIKQILINLLNNAVKYTNAGIVGLHIESENVGESQVILKITVSDTGRGIKKESLPYLFDAFKRVDEEKNRYVEGTGLGLNIVKMLVDMMNGTVAVNSVYGEGSVFNVNIRQGISDSSEVGEISIHNYGKAVKSHDYVSSFTAKDARVLIVDDNEMNLEVEKKLLLGTGMKIDTALSGREALNRTLENRYDVILMDHLMPEMDGIECLHNIRNQQGGLNNTTPEIILTANAAADNKELYMRAGFEGYLAKPISGKQLENMIVKYISAEKLSINTEAESGAISINNLAGYVKKSPVIIATTSMCDLPHELIRKHSIPRLPYYVKTEEGVFKDGVQVSSGELVRYIKKGKKATNYAPEVSDYTEFFAANLKNAHHLIYIAQTSTISDDYRLAMEAASSFNDVSVIDSCNVSSGIGLLVLIAYKLAQQDISADNIIAELERVKYRIIGSYTIENTDALLVNGLVKERIHRIYTSLELHPCIRLQEGKAKGMFMGIGDMRKTYKRMIKSVLSRDFSPDLDIVFVTYVDVSENNLQRIKEEILRMAPFENVIFKQASAVVAANCGGGSVGIYYLTKGETSYNIGSLLPSSDDLLKYDSSAEDSEESAETAIDKNHMQLIDGRDHENEETASKWYESVEGIDVRTAIKNSGSENAFETVLKIYYNSIDDKSAEINRYLENEDWDNYVIKVHALKSSSRLVGAMELGEAAQALEYAGKERNLDYIHSHHADFMAEYAKYKEYIAAAIQDDDKDSTADNEDKPAADKTVINNAYESIRQAATEMDCDAIDAVIENLDKYEIPGDAKETVKKIKGFAAGFDYDSILQLLENYETD